MKSTLKHLSTIIEILLAMSGVVLRRMTIARTTSILISLGIYALAIKYNSRATAIWYFVVATFLHYVVLFGFFARSGGWSKIFIEKYGEEEGFKRCEAIMTLVFFHNGASTALACTAAAGALYSYLPGQAYLFGQAYLSEQTCTFVGIAFSCIGLPIKVWATAIVGIDTYYYRDLFLRRSVGGLQARGPYRIFRNPMYGVGHLHGYGSALVAGSDLALVLVAVNQMLVWSFYFSIEKPHIHQTFGAEASNVRE